ncbi:MAG: hypothetical protein GQ532_06405 [Methylomarinum sp.]|nr:hypothetical protein [Methylomarinum sp.]
MTIGGYFEFELPVSKTHLYSDAIKFQSARAAFYALLEEGKPNRVWMPNYICDSMILPLHSLNIEVKFYDLTIDLDVSESVVLKKSDWLLYVNYFGICSAQEIKLLNRFNSNQLVFDHSQGFFTPPSKCLATIYSPRKFFGVPDGGYLFTDIQITEPTEVDGQAVYRCEHLLQRLDDNIEFGYDLYKKNEESFRDVRPFKMATLTNNLLSSLNYAEIKNIRNVNFKMLHERLEKINLFKICIASIDGALCYPLLIDDSKLKIQLLKKRIFVATYWEEVQNRAKASSLECFLVKNLIAIPCDQRYNKIDMEFVVDCIFKIVEKKC